MPCQKLAQCGTGPAGATVRTAGRLPGPLTPPSSAQGVRWNTSSIVVAYRLNTNGAYQLYMANVPPGARCARAAAIDCSVSRKLSRRMPDCPASAVSESGSANRIRL